jgi:Ca2+-binding RTX toxin-like protein
VSKVINNFSSAGSLTLAPTNGVSVGDTVDGVTITGVVLAGALGQADTLKGTAGNDYIVGGDVSNVLVGGAGDDVLVGGVASTPGGVQPHNVFKFAPHSGNDVIANFQGTDTINISHYLKHGAHPTVTDSWIGAVIQLDANDSITLLGVSSSQLVATATGFAHS